MKLYTWDEIQGRREATPFNIFRHSLAHAFGWNLGRVESWRLDDGTVYIGFRCATCHHMQGDPVVRLLKND